MEIEEVVGNTQLMAFLSTFEEERGLSIARRLAFLAALRGCLPELRILADDSAKRVAGVSALPMFASLALLSAICSGNRVNAILPKAAIATEQLRTSLNAVFKEVMRPTKLIAQLEGVPQIAAPLSEIVMSNTRIDSTAAHASFAAFVTGKEGFEIIRQDLYRTVDTHPEENVKVWPDGQPKWFDDLWSMAREQLESDQGESGLSIWTFWITWYERILEGKNTYPEKLAPILDQFTKDDWLGDPAKVNPAFDPILELYRQDELQELRAQVRQLQSERPVAQTTASIAQRSHNMPPELVENEARIVEAVTVIWADVDAVAEELEKPTPDETRLKTIASALVNGLKAIARYVGGKCDLLLDELIKHGAKAAGPLFAGAFGYFVSPKFAEFVQNLVKYLGMN